MYIQNYRTYQDIVYKMVELNRLVTDSINFRLKSSKRSDRKLGYQMMTNLETLNEFIDSELEAHRSGEEKNLEALRKNLDGFIGTVFEYPSEVFELRIGA